MATAVTPTPRERGWRRLLPALVAFLCVPLVPLFRVIVPVEQTLLLITPAMAACAVVGWWAGGRASLAIIWAGLAAWMLSTPLPAAGAYDSLARGWAAILAACFGLVCVLGSRRTFFVRALSATAIAFAVALSIALLSPSGIGRLGQSMRGELTRRVDASFEGWGALSQTSEWRDFSEKNPSVASWTEEGERQLRVLPRFTVPVFPALLGLESLAALALAWGLYHRVSRVRIGAPLAPLRDFRFNDQLIWGLVAGTVAVLLPTLSGFRGVGFNLLLFFGALYALRGFGVLTWFLAPGRLVTVLLIGFALLAWPLMGIFALGLGLGDTWLDWRSRARPTT